MEHWIHYPPAPKELLLAWQAPSNVEKRSRWAVGRLTLANGQATFDYLDEAEFTSLNNGRTSEELRLTGYAGYPAFDLKKRPIDGFHEHVLEAFLRRLPPSNRSDYTAYLEYFRLLPSTPISGLGLLAITEARLPSDGFSLVDPLDPEATRLDLVIEVAGYRFQPQVPGLTVGAELRLAPEPSNPHDANAVAIYSGDHRIGYVNRLQARTLREWLKTRSVSCWIARLNGRPEAPRAFAFLQVRPAADSIAA
jgi:hypothetical protein